MYHLFAGLRLPADIRARLGSLCQGLPGVLWLDPEHLHVTVRFVGGVDGATFRDIGNSLTRVSFRPFELSLNGVGFFPLRKRPERVWVGLEKSEALLRLHQKIDVALVRGGLPPEARKFAPHVTIGRFGPGPVKSDSSHHLADYLSAYSLFKSQPFTVDSFCLYSGARSNQGPHYTIEEEYPLEGLEESEE